MMKDEDRRYGEKAGKSHVVVKDRKQTLKTSAILNMTVTVVKLLKITLKPIKIIP